MNTQESRPPSGPGADAAPGGAGRPGEPAAEFFDRIRAFGVARPDEHRWAAGVCAGLARRWGLDPLLVRGLFVVGGIVTGIGLGVYGLLWLFLPHPDGRIHAQEVLQGRVTAGFVGAVLVTLGNISTGSQRLGVVDSGPWFWQPLGTNLVSLAVVGGVVWWFLAHRDRGVAVRQVPLVELASTVTPGVDVVAFSLVQSADGRVADASAVAEAARAVGALTVVDTTQAVGWYPVQAGDFDVTACSAYKWLCSPRGTAFLTVRPEVLERLRPIHAGWYAGESVWESVYGPQMLLAQDARRFDVSPAWLSWVGTAPALELFASADPAVVHAHDVRLTNLVRARLDLPSSDTAMLALADPDASLQARLVARGCAVAARAGRVRLSFHVWNDEDDVERAVDAVRDQPRTATRTAAASSP